MDRIAIASVEKVISTSGSMHKHIAVNRAVRAVQIKAPVEIIKGESGINEQPDGIEETLQGASNRIGTSADNPNHLVISIENGSMVIQGVVKDFAIVVVRFASRTVWEMSQTVTFPWEQYERARTAGFAHRSVGSFLEEDGIVKDGTDPHKELGGIRREEILEATILVCLHHLGFTKSDP